MTKLNLLVAKTIVTTAGSDLPSAKPLQTWLQGEVGSLIIIALVIMCAVSAFKRDTTKAILSIIVCAAFYVFVKNPDGTIIVWMQALTDLISGN